MSAMDMAGVKRRMQGAIEVLRKDFAGLRTGRASTQLLEPIMVEIYGSMMPLNQVGTISAPEPRMLSVQVWDRAAVIPVDKAIRKAGLGVNPIAEGQIIRVPLPELTQERRKELSKLAHKYAEQARVAVRNVRREGMEQLKKLEKDSKIGQDDHRHLSQELQKLTDETVGQVDAALGTKDKEIMQV
ncbi:MAG: ribosome recycling factor [Alphaproteobacteria bacterium]|nr:ribosome recycling factor [Alphaproteobacteria bacterium]